MARHPIPLNHQLKNLWYAVDNAGGLGSVGPKGDKGDKGDTGDTGPAGNDGAPGADGLPGGQGLKGDTGDTGPQGLTGNDGNDGSDGADGADGPSAYQVAVSNGFVGTQAQWLASLVGAQGIQGAAGATGATGATGAPGTNGTDGNDGAAGAKGDKGDTGDTGIAGTDASVTNANVNTAITDNRPATKTALLLVKADVGLGSVDNTADAAKAVLTAVKLATARNINGVAFDGSADITITAVDSTARVATTRSISTTAPLTGGGDLSANRTLAISAATSGAAGSMSASDKTKLDAITGSNTGDQTISLSGDVSGSGTGAITTAIGAGKVTLAMQANMATASVVYRKTAGAGAPEVQTLATLKTDLGLTGTNSGDQTSIVGITGTVAQFNTAITDADIAIAARNINTTAPITGGGDLSADRTIAISAATSGAAGSMSAADKSKLDGIASAATANSPDATLLARANHTGTQSISTILAAATSRFFGRITASGGAGEEMTGTQATTLLDLATGALKGLLSAADFTKLSGIATSATANSTDATLSAAYRTLLDSSGSHIAARVAGTYGFGQGDPVAISGTGTLYPLNIIRIDSADYPAIGALAAKLRVKATANCNDVAPGHNFVFGLHPITRPATSGGAGLCIYTIGAAVASSTVTATTPAADSSAAFTSSDFALPADGQYVLGVVTNGTTATSAHVHLSAALQLHYT